MGSAQMIFVLVFANAFKRRFSNDMAQTSVDLIQANRAVIFLLFLLKFKCIAKLANGLLCSMTLMSIPLGVYM